MLFVKQNGAPFFWENAAERTVGIQIIPLGFI